MLLVVAVAALSAGKTLPTSRVYTYFDETVFPDQKAANERRYNNTTRRGANSTTLTTAVLITGMLRVRDAEHCRSLVRLLRTIAPSSAVFAAVYTPDVPLALELTGNRTDRVISFELDGVI